MIFLIECAVLCLLFTVIVVASVLKDPVAWVDDYPPAIRQRAMELGAVGPKPDLTVMQMLKNKVWRILLCVAVLSAIVILVNGADDFVSGFTISYGLWFVLAWYDALVLDWGWACHSRKVRIPGTEDMPEYRDYGFHARMSVLGCILGLPMCALVGAVCALAGML